MPTIDGTKISLVIYYHDLMISNLVNNYENNEIIESRDQTKLNFEVGLSLFAHLRKQSFDSHEL